jgi:hypothetical protein
MSSVTIIRKIVERLGFSSATATYLTGTCGINSLDETAYLDGVVDVDTTIKGVTNPVGMVTTVMGVTSATLLNNGIPVSIREVANLKLCVYFLKHMERVQREPLPMHSTWLLCAAIATNNGMKSVSIRQKRSQYLIVN